MCPHHGTDLVVARCLIQPVTGDEEAVGMEDGGWHGDGLLLFFLGVLVWGMLCVCVHTSAYSTLSVYELYGNGG